MLWYVKIVDRYGFGHKVPSEFYGFTAELPEPPNEIRIPCLLCHTFYVSLNNPDSSVLDVREGKFEFYDCESEDVFDITTGKTVSSQTLIYREVYE